MSSLHTICHNISSVYAASAITAGWLHIYKQINFAKAFDKVVHNCLIKKLEGYDINGVILN